MRVHHSDLGRCGEAEVDQRWPGGAVPPGVAARAPVEGLEPVLLDVLSGVDDGPGRGSSREMFQLTC